MPEFCPPEARDDRLWTFGKTSGWPVAERHGISAGSGVFDLVGRDWRDFCVGGPLRAENTIIC